MKRTLLLFAVVLTAGCTPARAPAPVPAPVPEAGAAAPAPVRQTALPGLAEITPEQVEVVQVFPPIPSTTVHRPLFGARPADRPALAELLQGLAAAQPVDPAGADGEHRRMEWMEVRLTSGRRIMIRDAWNCTSTSSSLSCQTVPGKYVLAEGGQRVVAAPLLDQAMTDLRSSAMPLVEKAQVTPSEAKAGTDVTMSGEGWTEAKTYTIALTCPDGSDFELGRGPVTFGAYTWTGSIPPGWGPGNCSLEVHTDGGTLGVPFRVLL